MIKKIIYLLIIFFIVFPIKVNAGIICNDGWESSCVASGPGCCSNHGGVYNDNAYNSSYSSSEVDSNAQLYFFWLPLGIILGIIIIKSYIDFFKEKLNSTENDDADDDDN